MSEIAKFIFGFKRFQKDYFCADSTVFENLREEQKPRALLIGCSDSRVDPALLTSQGALFESSSLVRGQRSALRRHR